MLTGVEINWRPLDNGYKKWAKRIAIEVSNDPSCPSTNEATRNCFCNLQTLGCRTLPNSLSGNDRSCWNQVFPASGFYTRPSSGGAQGNPHDNNGSEELTFTTTHTGRYVRLYANGIKNSYNNLECGSCNLSDQWRIDSINFYGSKVNNDAIDLSPPTSCPTR